MNPFNFFKKDKQPKNEDPALLEEKELAEKNRIRELRVQKYS